MLNTKVKEVNFLDSLFTQKDFYFLNSLDDEINLIQTQIDKQEKIRDIIVDAINSFESSLKNLNKDNISPVSNLLEEVEKSFVLVNFNIRSLYSLKQTLTDINSGIVNLLVTIESDSSNKQSYMPKIESLKNSIANYSESCTSIKDKIANNDLILNSFLSSPRFKKIFNSEVNLDMDFSTDKENIKNLNIDKQEDSKDAFSISTNENNVTNQKNFSLENFNNKILRISEKENRVYLPYTSTEVSSYLLHFPDDYHSPSDVIKKEFILPLDYYIKHPVLSRFRETYSLIRDREGKSILEAIKYSMNLMFTYELSPTIIAACKTQEQLENYINCLQNNKLDNFSDFEIKFEINPL